MNVETSHGRPIVHGVECGHLVYPHWGHLQQTRDLVHHADACETMLSLAEIQQRHDSGLFVLRRVSAKDFLDELLILGVELERYVGIVVWRVTMLIVHSSIHALMIAHLDMW